MDDRDVEGAQGGCVPGLAVEPTGRTRRTCAGCDAARGQDRSDEHVCLVGADQLEDALCVPVTKRVAPERDRVGAGPFDAVAQLGDEARVPGDEVGSVEDDGDDRSGGGLGMRGRCPPDAEGRDRLRRLETVTLEQHRVGDEAQEVLEVLRPTVHEVGERFAEDRSRHGRERGELGIRYGLPGEGEERDAATHAVGPQRVESVLPCATAA